MHKKESQKSERLCVQIDVYVVQFSTNKAKGNRKFSPFVLLSFAIENGKELSQTFITQKTTVKQKEINSSA
jgi:hypothetical protein